MTGTAEKNAASGTPGVRLKVLRSLTEAARFRPLAARMALADAAPNVHLPASLARFAPADSGARLRGIGNTVLGRLPSWTEGPWGRRLSPLVEVLARAVATVSDAVNALSNEPSLFETALLVPHRRDVAVLVVDMRNFSKLTAEVDDDEYLTKLIEEYLTLMTEVVERHGGVVFQYTGDGLLALFLPGLSHEQPAATLERLATHCARDLHTSFDSMIERWKRDWLKNERSGYAVGLGVGLSYGPATVGLIGSTGKKQFSAIGAPINMSAFLCSQARSGTVLVDTASLETAGAEVPNAAVLRLRSPKLHQRIHAAVLTHGRTRASRRRLGHRG